MNLSSTTKRFCRSGLYSSDELVPAKKTKPRQMEWEQALVPFLRKIKAKPSQVYGVNHSSYRAQFSIDGKEYQLHVLRYAKIKVRKYGSKYHVDKNEERSERWQRTDVIGAVSELWKQFDHWFPDEDGIRLVLLIGFDKAARPLERELSALREELRWEERGALFRTRHWADKAGRGFGVHLAMWARAVDA